MKIKKITNLTLKKVVTRILYYSGLTSLYSRVMFNLGAIILYYHEISRKNFEDHINYFKKKRYNVISMDDLLGYYSRKKDIPRNTLVITFDDGCKSNYSSVFPVVVRYKVPVMVYLISGTLTSGIEPWFVTVRNIEKKCKCKKHLEEYLKRIPEEQKNRILGRLIKKHNYQSKLDETLSIEEVKEMLNSQLVSFGSHSLSHPCLNRMDIKSAKKEIVGSKKELEKLFSVSFAHFAYPNGDYTPEHIGVVRRAGYKTAVTTKPGVNDFKGGNNLLGLRRIEIGPHNDVPILATKISGLRYSLFGRLIENFIKNLT